MVSSVAGVMLLAGWPSPHPAAAQSPCVDGFADGFPCNQIGLLSHMPLDTFDLGFALKVWGFYDLNTEREYALVAFREGVSVVDVTDPASPRAIGTVLGDTAAFRDIRAYH